MLSRRIEFSRIFLPIPIGRKRVNYSPIVATIQHVIRYTFFNRASHVLKFPPSLLPHYSRKYSNGVLRRVFHGGKRIWVQFRQNVRSVFLSCDEKHNRIFPFSFVFNVNPRPSQSSLRKKKKKEPDKSPRFSPSPSFIQKRKTNRIQI